jgi:antitoxin (DNA-binding transcriptional repressor) of toxin-antitoxin stability system
VIIVPAIPRNQLQDNLAEVRRAAAGEEFTITVAGRPVAQLGPPRPPQPPRRPQWVKDREFAKVWETPAPKTVADDLEGFPGELVDPSA